MDARVLERASRNMAYMVVISSSSFASASRCASTNATASLKLRWLHTAAFINDDSIGSARALSAASRLRTWKDVSGSGVPSSLSYRVSHWSGQCTGSTLWECRPACAMGRAKPQSAWTNGMHACRLAVSTCLLYWAAFLCLETAQVARLAAPASDGAFCKCCIEAALFQRLKEHGLALETLERALWGCHEGNQDGIACLRRSQTSDSSTSLGISREQEGAAVRIWEVSSGLCLRCPGTGVTGGIGLFASCFGNMASAAHNSTTPSSINKFYL